MAHLQILTGIRCIGSDEIKCREFQHDHPCLRDISVYVSCEHLGLRPQPLTSVGVSRVLRRREPIDHI